MHARFAPSETGNRVDANARGPYDPRTAGQARRPAAMESRVGRLTTSATPESAHDAQHHHDHGIEGPAITAEGLRDHAATHAVARRAGRPHQRCDEALRRRRRRRQHGPRRRPRLVLLVPRPIGLRQDDDPAHDRGLRAADLGRDLPRRRAGRGRAALPAPREHRVPALRAVPAHDRRPERRLRAAPEGHQQARRAAPRRGGAGPRPARGLRHAPDVGAVGRAAAARRARAGAHQPPDRAPPRRAARARST